MSEKRGGDSEEPSSPPPPPPPPPPQGRSCRGVLYLSSARKGNAGNPFCFGLSRPEHEVRNYTAGRSEQELTKDGKALMDFKYACVGYSVHRYDQAASGSASSSDKHAELPMCVGIEMMAEKRNMEGAATSRSIQKGQESEVDKSGSPAIPRPASSIRQPPNVGLPLNDFSIRFIRSAGHVAASVVKNLSKIGKSIKDTADDIFHPDRSRPK